MGTVTEFLRTKGCKFDVVPDGNGNFLYKDWCPASEVYEGKVVKLGKRYQFNMIVADANGNLIDTVLNPDSGVFVEDADAWAQVFGLDSTEGLVGMSVDNFYAEIARRAKTAPQRN